jgi:accessory colonization factor AcfC
MDIRWCLFVSLLLLAPATAGASSQEPVKVLRAYGPGGPHHVLKECAELFRQRHGVAVAVIKAAPAELARRVREDGDIYFGGAGYMLEDFSRENPDLLDMRSVETLHPRRVGVVVRKGNPLNIKGVECLQREGVDLLVARLENMAQFYAPGSGRMDNVRREVHSGQEGVDAWRAARELDAWVTYKSWHVSLEGESDFVELPGDQALRFTPVAMTRKTPYRHEAKKFFAFLKSPEAREIFVAHGWE